MKKGFILEGGAMRGMFTAGVIDVMMEDEITAVGSMACFTCKKGEENEKI